MPCCQTNPKLTEVVDLALSFYFPFVAVWSFDLQPLVVVVAAAAAALAVSLIVAAVDLAVST